MLFSLLFKFVIFAFVGHLLVPVEAADICSVKTKNADDCREICLRSVYCRYFTYVTNWKICHLKGQYGWRRTTHPYAISGSITFPENIPRVDFYGGDLQSPC
uniref:Apple domain-containing protein n=1 Tax=Clytia hemisphaerica TaxID=252671 RepID=A0A7M5V8A3_9CNID